MRIWTSRANDAYLSLICHFTAGRWDMITFVLAKPLFPEYQTADNEKIHKVMEYYI